MAVRKDEKRGKWLAEVYQGGKRFRKWFETKGEANRYYKAMKQENSPLLRAVLTQREPSPKLSELAETWYNLHGRTLVKGLQRLKKIKLIAETLGDPPAKEFTSEHFAEYREKRLNGQILFRNKTKNPVSYSTLNL